MTLRGFEGSNSLQKAKPGVDLLAVDIGLNHGLVLPRCWAGEKCKEVFTRCVILHGNCLLGAVGLQIQVEVNAIGFGHGHQLQVVGSGFYHLAALGGSAVVGGGFSGGGFRFGSRRLGSVGQ